MMRLAVTFPSTTLLRPVEIAVALPGAFSMAKAPYRTLWALHCAMESGEFFFDSLNAAAIAERHRIALIAPSLGNGYFINSPLEAQGDFLREMLDGLREMLPLARQREDNAVLGVSMGAFGAVRWALDSGAFGGVAAISGVFDCLLPPDERLRKNRAQRALYLTFDKIMRRMLLHDDGTIRAEADLDALLRKSAGSAPRLHLYCGEGDFLSLPHSGALADLYARHGARARFCLAAGEHDRAYWNTAFADAVAALFGDERGTE